VSSGKPLQFGDWSWELGVKTFKVQEFKVEKKEFKVQG